MKYKIIFFTSMIIAQFIYWLRTFFWLLDGNTSRDMILLCIFTVSQSFAFMLYFIAMKKVIIEARAAYKLELLKQEQELHEQEAASMERLNKEAEAYKADIINQMEVLLNTLKSGNHETVTEDFNLLTHRLNTLASHQYCNHSLLNAILHDKFLVAQNFNIRVSYSILLPERIDIPLNELASILFNLLDNAIEACQNSAAENRFIRLETKYVGKILSIHMENTKNPQIIFKRQTTKADSLSHGFGLSIIEDIASAHNGSCNWIDHGDTFESVLMLEILTDTSKEMSLC